MANSLTSWTTNEEPFCEKLGRKIRSGFQCFIENAGGMHSALRNEKKKKEACNLIHNITPRLSMQIHSTLELRSSQYPQPAGGKIKQKTASSHALTSNFKSTASFSTATSERSTICNLQPCSGTSRVGDSKKNYPLFSLRHLRLPALHRRSFNWKLTACATTEVTLNPHGSGAAMSNTKKSFAPKMYSNGGGPREQTTGYDDASAAWTAATCSCKHVCLPRAAGDS